MNEATAKIQAAQDEQVAHQETSRALFVDLDGTLIATDIAWENILAALRRNPFNLLLMPWWFAAGKAAMKRKLALLDPIDPATLPYRTEVLEFLRQRKAAGQRLVLATASDEQQARAVAGHLGLFDAVIASDGITNMGGVAKLRAIQVAAGESGFDYMGNSHADVAILESAATGYLVAPRRSVLHRARRTCPPRQVFTHPHALAPTIMKALRPHQWAKNTLLFIPLIVGHQASDLGKLWAVILAFVSFSLAASATYVWNDLLDLPSDRRHPSKRHRPFASGALPLQWGPPLIAILLGTSFAIALTISLNYVAIVVFYLVLTTVYTITLKRRLLLDVMCLAGLYAYRLVAGSAAADVLLSPWLLAFSMFLFLSLAFAKRYAELRLMDLEYKGVVEGGWGRNYTPDDMAIIASVGPTSGYLAVLVLSLYINSDTTRELYDSPRYLWFICPILLYWITRVWFFARRGALHDDPVVFALRDRVSYLAGASAAVLLVLATI